MISYDDIMKLKKGLDEPDTTEPFLYTDKEDIKVVGDPNNTKLNKHDYTLIFETETGERLKKVYNNVFVAPRKRINVVRLVSKMLPYFRKADEEGNLTQLTNMELAEMIGGMEKEIYDIAYDLAEEVLEVPNNLKDYIEPVSALMFGVKLIIDNPAVVKEADQSFG